MKAILNFFISTVFFVAISSHADSIAVFDAGGLNGLSALRVANRLDKILHKQGRSIASVFHHAIGVSSGAQAAALLFERQENGQAVRTSSDALDIFLQEAPGTFSNITNFAERLMNAYVNKDDINRVLTRLNQHKGPLSVEQLKSLLSERFTSDQAFWLRSIDVLLDGVNVYNTVFSTTGEATQTTILKQKLSNTFGASTFLDDGFKDVIVIAADGSTDKPILISHKKNPIQQSSLFEDSNIAAYETSVVDALTASAAFRFFSPQMLSFLDGSFSIDVVDGANAYTGTSPLKTAIDWRIEVAGDDTIVLFGNGGPVDEEYFASIFSLDFDRNFAVVNKPNGGFIYVYRLNPHVEHWCMSAIVEEKSLAQGLLTAADNIADEEIERVAKSFVDASTVGEIPAWHDPSMEIRFKEFSTATPSVTEHEVGAAGVEVVDVFKNLFNLREAPVEQLLQEVTPVAQTVTNIFQNPQVTNALGGLFRGFKF